MTTDPREYDRGIDAAEADYVEQRTDVPDPADVRPEVEPGDAQPFEANEADVAEQRMDVPLDDEP